MHSDSDRQKLFSRRAAMLAGGKFALLSALVGRMYYLQVIESARYATLAEENRINLRLLAPPRGRIVDRFGVPMAVNQQNYRVVLISEDAHDVEETLQLLGAIIPIGDGEKRRILRDVRRRRGFVPVTVRENLNWEEVARIEVNTPDLPGVMIDVGQSRDYPHGEDTAHVLGYVAAVSEAEIGRDPLLELPGFRIGKAGIEKVYDLALRGTGGSSQVEVNALGRVIREMRRQEGQPGAEVTLTIDLELQQMVVRRLGGESAAVVVMDVHTGDVLAMASTPSFDPNSFNKGLSAEEWRGLVSNPRAPLTNKAIRGQYPPGSTFKIVVALAALAKGVITPETTFVCPGFLKLGNARFHCWKRGGHGIVDLAKGITESCDVYFYETARRTGIDRIAAMARRLGLGKRLGLDLPGEQPGLVPTSDWKLATMDMPWQKGETLITGIGQGYLLVTPLQLAVMTARLVNGGFAVTPHMTRNMAPADGTAPGPRPGSLGVAAAYLKVVREATAAVVNAPKGTAYKARITEAGLEMGGKTGTVQVKRITKAERDAGVRKNKDRPWKDRDHAVFVGYAPAHAPRYAVAVLVEHGGGGSTTAAPIARDILLEAQHRNAARPDTGPLFTRISGPGAPAGRG
ncbi:MAG: penicillin-binding protein 2 [Rhodospirillales bacterium]